ncbi:cysteine desulfurase [Bacillus sp. V3-13]|uniref:IscS subfamily cysteine desulfurase n=1 Tax=Bacillus sp. V3-13 TaxID=2053728 RepID=UPI000C786A5B|nr:cysteine desulfurase [Bacillus sp. V3-13]
MKYFDYAASCPLDEEAAQAFVKASIEYFGNSRSLHDIGSNAEALLENCRTRIANYLGVEQQGLFFTSGGSESNFLAIYALLSATQKKGKHIITGMAEHSSIQSTMKRLIREGYEITFLPLNENGQISLEQLTAALREDTVLLSIQHANPEIGRVQPIAEIWGLCKKNNILLHSDCVQTFGKLDLKPILPDVDSISISGHKIYGPKGIGAAYINPRISCKPFFPGTSHENGFRPGTVNIPAIVAMTVAAQKAYAMMDEQSRHFQLLRQRFIDSLSSLGGLVTIYGSDTEDQIPSIAGLTIKGVAGQWTMLECNRKGYAISTGSACQTGMQTPSKTMKAMGLSDKTAKEFIRISFGRDSAVSDVEELGQTICNIIHNAVRQ